jgi:hypothetical protein
MVTGAHRSQWRQRAAVAATRDHPAEFARCGGVRGGLAGIVAGPGHGVGFGDEQVPDLAVQRQADDVEVGQL